MSVLSDRPLYTPHGQNILYKFCSDIQVVEIVLRTLLLAVIFYEIKVVSLYVLVIHCSNRNLGNNNHHIFRADSFTINDTYKFQDLEFRCDISTYLYDNQREHI